MDESLGKIRHERSVKDFPFLKLEDDEYVEFAFKRAKVCLMRIIIAVTLGLALILIAVFFAVLNQDAIDDMGKNFLFIILATLIAVAVLAGVIAVMIYNGNRLFITNKHVIQMVMTSPMSTSINVIDLQSIEDASFRQDGLWQRMFGYGTFRLSTVGDETTYTFPYSDIAPSELKSVSDLITNAKKRPRKKKSEEVEVEEEAEN